MTLAISEQRVEDAPRCAPSSERGKIRYNKILDAALVLFSERDYADVSMAEIGREAGGSLATLYKWFGNKDELLYAVMKRRVGEVADYLKRFDFVGKDYEDDVDYFLKWLFLKFPQDLARVALFHSAVFAKRSDDFVKLFDTSIAKPLANIFANLRARRNVESKLTDAECALLVVRYARGALIESMLSPEKAPEILEQARVALKKILVLTIKR